MMEKVILTCSIICTLPKILQDDQIKYDVGGHVARMTKCEMRTFGLERPEGKRPLGRPKR
jgi:hypothetical protein